MSVNPVRNGADNKIPEIKTIIESAWIISLLAARKRPTVNGSKKSKTITSNLSWNAIEVKPCQNAKLLNSTAGPAKFASKTTNTDTPITNTTRYEKDVEIFFLRLTLALYMKKSVMGKKIAVRAFAKIENM